MERRIIETDLGPIWLWGLAEAFTGDRPVVLVIRGTLPLRHDLEWLESPSHDLVFAHLPGFHCPLAVTSSVGVFIAAFDAVIRRTFDGRRLIVLGSSAGALVAAGLRSPQIVARMFIEPFFSTAKLTALAPLMRELMVAVNQQWFRDWVWSVLGIADDAVADRRYAHLLTGDLPIYALVGDPKRRIAPPEQLPSLTDEADRALLVAAGAQMRMAAAGHDVPWADANAIVRTLREVTAAHP
jgi:hypothetical protein